MEKQNELNKKPIGLKSIEFNCYQVKTQRRMIEKILNNYIFTIQ
jgi:hypothetical protein